MGSLDSAAGFAWAAADLLPGLLAAAAAFGLDRLLRTLGDRVPRRAWALLGLILVLLLGAPLVGGRVLLPLDGLRGEAPFRLLSPTDPPGNPLQGDQLQLLAPAQAAAREAWRAGEWPLFNRRLGGASPELQVPVLGDPQAQALQPLALATLPLSLLAAPGTLAALRITCAFVFFFAFARRQGLSEGAAVAGAVAWSLGGFVQLWLGWPIATTAALLPAALYAVSLLDEEETPRARHRVFAALAFAALLLGGHPETIAYALLLVAAFALAAARRHARRPLPDWAWIGRTLLPSALLAVALAAPALVPASAAARRSERAFSPTPSVHPRDDLASRLLPIVAPNAYGNDRFARADGVAYWGRHNVNEDASGFSGTFALFTLLLTLAGILAGPRSWRCRRGERLVLLFGLAAMLWIALPPTVRLALVPAPLLALVRAEEHRILLWVALALAYGVACAVDRAQSEGEKPSRLVVLGLSALLAAALYWAYRAHPYPADPAALAPLREGWLALQGKVLLLSAVFWLWVSRQRWASGAAVFLLAAELLVAHAPANPPAPRVRALPSTPALEFLRQRAAPPERIAALGDALPSGLASLYGLADARAYNPMAPRALRATLEPALEPGGGPPRLAVADHPALDRLGVGLLLTEPGVEVAGSSLLYDGPDARVWRRPHATALGFTTAAGIERRPLAGGLAFAALGLAAAVAGWARLGLDS